MGESWQWPNLLSSDRAPHSYHMMETVITMMVTAMMIIDEFIVMAR